MWIIQEKMWFNYGKWWIIQKKMWFNYEKWWFKYEQLWFNENFMWNIMGTNRIHCDLMGFFMGVPLKSWGIPSRHRDLIKSVISWELNGYFVGIWHTEPMTG